MIWYDEDYSYKKKITIDHTKVNGDEIDFPVLVSVTDNDLRDEANGGHVKNANGYDIIFTNGAEDTQFKHEIERYVNTNGTLVYWVKIVSISSTAPDTEFYIYYGKAGVGADPSTTDTWDANYMAVYHMDDLTTSTIKDSTINGNNGIKSSANNPIEATGKIGKCQDFSGDHINIGRDGSLSADALTMSAWFKQDTNNLQATLLACSRANNYFSWYIYKTATPYMVIYGRDGGVLWSNASTAPATTVGNWHYTAVNIGSGAEVPNLYLDTTLCTVGWPNAGNVVDRINHNVDIFMGRIAGAFPLDGKIDEMRLSDVDRGSNWILTDYNTQNDPSAFMSFGVEESLFVPPPIGSHKSSQENIYDSDSSHENIFNSKSSQENIYRFKKVN